VSTDTHVLRAFKFRLDPNPEQAKALASNAGAARVAFNYALARKNAAHDQWHLRRKELMDSGLDREAATVAMKLPENKVKLPTAFDNLAAYRTEQDVLFPWWREVSSYAWSSGMADADAAYKNHFDSLTGKRRGAKMGRPRFKSKHRSTPSFRLYHDVKKPTIRPDGSHHLRLPRIGKIRVMDGPLMRTMRKHIARHDGQITSASVSYRGGRWYVSILVRTPETANAPKPSRRQRTAGIYGDGTLGVDLGVALLAATSDGAMFDRLDPARQSQARMVQLQRALARSQRGSNRARKLKGQIGALHHKIALQRANAHHQLSTSLVNDYATIVLEDLGVKRMSKSAKGTVEKPGRNVKAKAGLNRSILDAGWGELRRQFEYKSARHGSTVVVVPPAYTSRTCAECGHVASESRESQAVFRCVKCDHLDNADVNAAKNIRNRGLATLREQQDQDAPVSVRDGLTGVAHAAKTASPGGVRQRGNSPRRARHTNGRVGRNASSGVVRSPRGSNPATIPK
jgi:putative transposase